MATKKAPAKGGGKRTPSYELSAKERASLRKGAEADMKKHGFKTVKELESFYDSKRGY